MPNDNPGFRITRGRGFQIKFANGWGISIQFGWGNYCKNHDTPMFDEHGTPVDYQELDRKLGEQGCANAEIALITPDGDLLSVDEWANDSVEGHVTPDEALSYMLRLVLSEPLGSYRMQPRKKITGHFDGPDPIVYQTWNGSNDK